MKKLVQQLIVILTLAAFTVTLPGCGDSEEADPILPEQGNDEDEDQGGAPAGDGNDGGEGEGDSGGGDGEGA